MQSLGLPAPSCNTSKRTFDVVEELSIQGKGEQAFRVAVNTKLGAGHHAENNKRIAEWLDQNVGLDRHWSCLFFRHATEQGKTVWAETCSSPTGRGGISINTSQGPDGQFRIHVSTCVGVKFTMWWIGAHRYYRHSYEKAFAVHDHAL